MNYTQAIAYLNSFINFESLPDAAFRTTENDLIRFEKLLIELGYPQSKYPIIHIAGTKGKGSTAAILESILIDNGYKVGLFTSPHLITVRERIRIDRLMISQESFAGIIEQIAASVTGLNQGNTDSFRTVFEHLTAAGLCYFAAEQVDLAIVETGLGGRLDATNVVQPILSILTPIGLDHTAILGDTVEAIAAEKVHIIKQNVPSVSAQQLPSVKRIIKDRAVSVSSELQFAPNVDVYSNLKLASDHLEFDIDSDVVRGKKIILSLNGAFQLENLSTALCAISVLVAQGYIIARQSTRAALQKVDWDGRFQQIDRDPVVILDGAHNHFSIQTVIDSLSRQFPHKRWRIVFGTLKNKPWIKMLIELSNLSADIYIAPLQFPKTLDIFSERDVIKDIIPTAKFYKNAVDAFQAARGAADRCDGILIIGSLYLVGEIRRKYAKLPPPAEDGKIDDRI